MWKYLFAFISFIFNLKDFSAFFFCVQSVWIINSNQLEATRSIKGKKKIKWCNHSMSNGLWNFFIRSNFLFYTWNFNRQHKIFNLFLYNSLGSEILFNLIRFFSFFRTSEKNSFKHTFHKQIAHKNSFIRLKLTFSDKKWHSIDATINTHSGT